MPDWQLELQQSVLLLFKVVTKHEFTVYLHETVVVISAILIVYVQVIRCQTEVNNVVFVHLLDSIGYTFKM